MKLIRPALIAAAALLTVTACAQTPTSTAAAPGSARLDGGNTMGSGNYVPTDSTQRGGNTLGGGG